jgi:predicted nucleotidyltransferase component of viral defense system
VRYASAVAFRTALEVRLRAEQSTGVGLSRLRKRVVFERLLARLVSVASDAWVLKGGFALELRLGSRARSTRDVDLDWLLGEDDVGELLRQAAALELDDYFDFTIESTVAADDLAGGGERWAVDAVLAGRLFERVAIDIGFGAPVLKPDSVVSSQLLAFADLQPTTVRALAIEQHVAEKLHAYTRTYARGQSSSRVKDLVDVVVIARTTELDARHLRHAIDAIFSRRAAQPVPSTVPHPPADWARSWGTLAAHVAADDDVKAGHAVAAALLDPILARQETGTWDPAKGAWR